MTNSNSAMTVLFDGSPLRIEDVVALARRHAHAALSCAPAFEARIRAGADFVDALLRDEGVIYGVTTGYGDSVTVAVPAALVAELPQRLVAFHGCGMGRMLAPDATRAVLAARLASLAQGASGVSLELLAQLAALLVHDVLPLIPEEGSVGASGDLTPLSYVAAALCGERRVYWHGRERPAAEALAALDLAPLRLRPKEGLALMNGTAVMTGLACLAFRARGLSVETGHAPHGAAMCSLPTATHTISTRRCTLSSRTRASRQWLRAYAHDLDGGHGQRATTSACRTATRCAARRTSSACSRTRYRCLRRLIETELNSANDNPIVRR